MISTTRHSLSHIMAQAVKSLYGNDVKMAIGPDTDTGFYYDFDFNGIEFKEEDLKLLEKKMKQIIKQNQKFEQYELPFEEARDYLSSQGEEYKVEMAGELFAKWNKTISFYKNIMQNEETSFIDMCSGPHVDNTNKIDSNSFALEKIAWAYWRWDSSKKMLTRIYGLAFETPEELQNHIKMIEEAKKRDHRILWKKLKLFTISDLVWAWLPLMQPAWMIVRKEIENYLWDLHKKHWYERVHTPHLAKEDLYVTSGHAGHYLEDMFSVYGWTSKEKFHLKPMNCPHHMQIFADNQFSYRDMPVRYFEPATVYRDEKTGQLSGLTRVRSITQDDWHLFCRVWQIKDEVKLITDIIKQFYSTMWMLESYWVSLSVRDDEDRSKYLWTDEVWEKAEGALEEAAKANELPYKRMPGEAAFYWPKLDFMFKDCLGREWQLATIQCDFNLPERFKLSFTNEAWEEERPVVIHRAISGSLERFMWIIIEHFAGAFPLWMSPRQVLIVPVAEKFDEYAKKINETLKDLDIRSNVDFSADSFSKKIRNWEINKYNYIVIVWEEEVNNNSVSIRDVRTKEQITMKIDEFVYKLTSEIKQKSL